MSDARTFNRPPRIPPPQLEGEIEIPPPPSDSQQVSQPALVTLLPAAGILAVGLLYMTLSGASGIGFALPMLGIGIVSVITAALAHSFQQLGQRRSQIRAHRDYHLLIDRRMARLQAARDLQTRQNAQEYPPPQRLILHAPESLRWNRRIEDDDFASVRLGVGSIASTVTIHAPDPDLLASDVRRAIDLAVDYRRVPDTGVVLNLRQAGSLGIVGDREETIALLYAILGQLAAFHAPSDLAIYIFSSRIRYRSWSWARWLPHCSARYMGGFPDFIAYEAEHARQLLDALARRIDARREDQPADRSMILVIFDDVASIRDEVSYRMLVSARLPNLIALSMAHDPTDVPSDFQGMIQVTGGAFRVTMRGDQPDDLRGQADMLTRAEIETLARGLANLKLPQLGEAGRIPTSLSFLQMYGVDRADELGIRERWERPLTAERSLPLAVPIGNDSFSTQLMLDLSERAHGPHGVVAGTTGSGKSELLQTIVAALAVEHHPYLLNFLLIDYKGGATFNVFRDLPHTVGIITNLNAIEALRALEAIKAENRRRQQFLVDKNAEDITEYHRRLTRVGGQMPRSWEPLPHLAIIVDEFAELMSELPGFLNELVATVRVGRSLGMHLILATQRPAGHVTPEMSANLNFRLVLRVQTPEESRDMIRRPDAAFLPPNIPGRAFFQVGAHLEQFQVARVGVEYNVSSASSMPGESVTSVVRLVRYERVRDLIKTGDNHRLPIPGLESLQSLIKAMDLRGTTESVVRNTPASEMLHPTANANERRNPATASRATQIMALTAQQVIPTLAEVLSQQMAGIYNDLPFRRTEPVLLESLAAEIPLDRVLMLSSYGGWNGFDWPEPGAIRSRNAIPVGLIDDLARHAQPPLTIDFTTGHFIAAGGPGTGKTTLLRTMIMAIARLYRPDEAEIYVLSFAGRGLDTFEQLPHVGAVIRTDERERFTRLLRRLLAVLDERRYQLSQVNADDLPTYNERAQRRNLPALRAVYILIDNFVELRQTYEDEVNDLMRLIRDGRAVGLHFAITAPTANLPYPLMNAIEQRFAFRLPERSDYSLFLSRLSERDLDPRPGSGLFSAKPPLHCQIALPASGEHDDARDQALAATLAAMRTTWGDRPRAESVQVLGDTIPLEALTVRAALPARTPLPPTAPPPTFYEPLRSPVGIDGLTLQPRIVNWLNDGPHFLINGPVASGKSTLIRTLILGIAERYSPAESSVLLVDFSQRSLRPLRRLPHVIDYATDERSLFANLRHFQTEMVWRREESERRKQRGGDEGESLDEGRSFFPPIIVAIDDYDQLQDALGGVGFELFDALGQIIRRDSRLGFHFIIAGETSAMQRAGDTILKQIRLTRTGFALSSVEAVEALGGRITTAMRREQLPDGRGYQVTRNVMRLVQFGFSLEPGRTARTLAERWAAFPRATWAHPAADTELFAPLSTAETASSEQRSLLGLDFELDLGGALEDYKKQQGYS